MNSRGNISFVLVFALLSVAIIFMFAFLSPTLQVFTTKIYGVGEPLLEDANTTALTFNDATIKNTVQSSLQASKDTTATQIEVLNFFYQYAWLFVIGLVSLILLLFSRFLVERQVGGAV